MRRTIPCTSPMSGPQSPLDAGTVENPARDFFDRDFRRIEHRYSMPLEQRLGRSDFEGHLRRRRIEAIGTPLVANLLQSIGLDGEAEQLPRVRFERRRQISRFEIVLGQRIIRGEYS